MIYVGALSFNGSGSGYQDLEGFASTITRVRRLGLSNFGGVMLWDGSEGLLNKYEGVDYQQGVKNALDGSKIIYLVLK